MSRVPNAFASAKAERGFKKNQKKDFFKITILSGLPVILCGAKTAGDVFHMGREAATGLLKVREHLFLYPMLNFKRLYGSTWSCTSSITGTELV